MKQSYSRLLRLILFSFSVIGFSQLHAEGSKTIYPTGASGGRADLYSGTSSALSFPFPTIGEHYVYAEAGEQIALATSAQWYNSSNGAQIPF